MTVGEIDNYFKKLFQATNLLFIVVVENIKNLLAEKKYILINISSQIQRKFFGKIARESKMVIFALSFHS